MGARPELDELLHELFVLELEQRAVDRRLLVSDRRLQQAYELGADLASEEEADPAVELLVDVLLELPDCL